MIATGLTQGWPQVGELGLALLLSAAIGVERERRQKAAGLRTHTLVGVGAALFMLVSKYGFSDVLEAGKVVVDPSRVAAQIVTGVGFLGAGLIFVRRDAVRGLTTAAAVWVTAAVGAAAGAGLSVLAVLATAVYFLVVLVFPIASAHFPATGVSELRVRYPDGQGVLRQLLNVATEKGFTIDHVSTERIDGESPLLARPGAAASRRMVEVRLRVRGRPPGHELTAALSELDDVYAVLSDEASAAND
jgi:putative Mg2+ transporter-C (MgtC) family protein